jgi:hypothetical protein
MSYEFYEPVGPPPFVQKQKDRDDYSAPPRPGDGTWIVNEFLNEFLGDEGGRLFTGNAEKSPEFESEHVKVQLKNCIARSTYQHYPWKSTWEEYVNNDRSKTTLHIRENITFCRPIPETRQLNKSGGKTANGKTKMHNGMW